MKKCIEQQKCYEQMQIKVREDTLSAMRNTYEAWLKKEQTDMEKKYDAPRAVMAEDVDMVLANLKKIGALDA